MIAHLGGDSLLVGRGPLAGGPEVAVRPFAAPAVPVDGANPLEYRFVDWDGDGAFDLLVAAQYREAEGGPWCYGIFWSRNEAVAGEPRFAAPARLLTIPGPWQLNAFAVADRDGDARPDLVVGVHKDWKRVEGVGWSGVSRLWLYRRRP